MTPKEEILERGRRNVEAAKRMNATVCLVIGVIFGLFALACFVGAAVLVVAGLEIDDVRGASFGGAVAVGVFGLFWLALTVLLVGLGRRGFRKLDREQRLRTSGVRGKATVHSYVESSFMVDGATNFELAVRVAIEGRPPWDMRLNEPVVRGNGAHIYQGATLPVLVNPMDASEVMVDWSAT